MKIDTENNGGIVLHSDYSVLETQARQESRNVRFSEGTDTVYQNGSNDMLVERAVQNVSNANQDSKAEDSTNQQSVRQMKELANKMTEDDLAELKKQGEDAQEESVDVIVTVVDKIKTELATYCDDYQPVMNDLSSAQLKELAGTSQNAEHIARKLKESQLPVTEDNVRSIERAMALTAGLTELSDSAKMYIVRNDMELTVENVYSAEYSSTTSMSTLINATGYYEDSVSGYYSKKAQEPAFDKLQGQMEQVIRQAGLEVNDETMGQARWLLEKQIPLIDKTMSKLNEAEQLELPVDTKAVMDSMLNAIKEGKNPENAQLGQSENLIERAQNAVSVIQNATDENLKTVIASQKEVTIEALQSVQNEQYVEIQSTGIMQAVSNQDVAYITAKRQLEEIRLQMTLQASAAMLKNGIKIETESLQALVEDLRAVEDSYYRNLLSAGNVEPSQENTALFKEITTTVSNLAASPAEILGIAAKNEIKQTIAEISVTGTEASEKYKQAEAAYETVMTKPRSDMGDSIHKAFRNVDDIVGDLNLELTEENRRAVRILGYNGIEITEENLFKVKSADVAVNRMIQGMAPSNVLSLIREGYNPLNKTVDVLNEKLEQVNANTVASEEKYSEYLYKLEQNNEITQEERSAYIGIYRLLHQVEKSDGAVVGSLVMQEAEVSMQNLMTGVRSRKHFGMDYKVDDTTGERTGVQGVANSITEQIEAGFAAIQIPGSDEQEKITYYQNLIRNTLETLSPNHLEAMMNRQDIMNMSLEQFAEAATMMAEEQTQADQAYLQEKLSHIQECARTEGEVIQYLTNQGQTVSVNNIFAAEQLLNSPGNMFRRLQEQSQRTEGGKEALEQAAEQLEEGLTDANSAEAAYDNLLKTAEAIIDSGVEDTNITYAEMYGWKQLHCQLRLAGNLSRREEYYVPVELNGEMTAVRLSFAHNTGEQKVTVTTQTEVAGKLGAEFTIEGDGVNAYLVSDSGEGRELLEHLQGSLAALIESETGFSLEKTSYAQYDDLNLNRFSRNKGKVEGSDAKQASAENLYQIAKSFLHVLVGKAKE